MSNAPLRLLVVGLIAAAATACDPEPSTPAVDASAPDAAADPLVGAWREVPSAFATAPPPVAERVLYTFAADGSFAKAEGAATRSGTYATAAGELTLTYDTGVVIAPYRISGGRIALDILERTTPGAGLVGTWTGHVVHDTRRDDVTLTLGADQHAHVETHSSTGDQFIADGTWTDQSGDLDVTLTIGGTTGHIQAALIDGVLGTPFERL